MSRSASPLLDPHPPPDLTRGAASASWLERSVGAVEQRWRLALAGLLLLDGALLMYMGRGLTFFFDEWDFVTHDFGGGLHSILLAHVGNISVVPVLVYKALFHLVGLNHYPVFRIVLIALHLLCGALVFALASKRIGRVPALLATALILFLGAAWEDLLWPFQIGYLSSIAGGLGAWLLLEREDRLGDAGALVCLLLATGSSSLGIPMVIGVAAELAWRHDWKRCWVVAVPAALYVLWYLGYGESQVTEASLIHAPPFAMDLMAGAAGALTGRGLDWGRPLAVAGVVALVWRLSRPGSISPRLAGLLVTGLSLWAITAATRSTISVPETSRYVYLGAVVIVLVGAELLSGRVFAPRALALATVLVAFAAVTGLTVMRGGADGLREDSHAVAAELGGLELAAAYAPPDYQPDASRAPQIRAGDYLHTVRAIGSSPADSPSVIDGLDSGTRGLVDGVLISLEAPRVTPQSDVGRGTAAGGVPLVSLAAGRQLIHGGCTTVVPTSAGALTAVVDVGGRGLSISDLGPAPATTAFRRFGDGFQPVAPAIAPHGAATLSVSADGYQAPWQAQVTSLSPVRACRIPE